MPGWDWNFLYQLQAGRPAGMKQKEKITISFPHKNSGPE
jgi:hypothetical protein